MKALLRNPKNKSRRSIYTYLKRLKLKSRTVIIVEGSEENLMKFKKVVERYGGKLVIDVKILIDDK